MFDIFELLARRLIDKTGGNEAPNRLFTGGSAYTAGPEYTGGTYTSNNRPLNNGDAQSYINRRAGVPGQGAGFHRNEPAVDQTSLVSFEDSIQNVVF